MARADFHLVNETDEIEQQFRSVMRRLAGGVSIITAGRGNDITGMTVTSLTALSATPPRLLISINRQASSFALIERHRLFGDRTAEGQEQARRVERHQVDGSQIFEVYF